MRPILPGVARRRALIALALAVLTSTFAGSTAYAVGSARFVDSDFASGFQDGDLVGIEPQYEIATRESFLSAAQVTPGGPIDPSLAVAYSLAPCLLLEGSSDCQPQLNVGDGPTFTFIAEITIEAIQAEVPESGLLFFLSGLSRDPSYSVDDITLVFDQDPKNGFTFDPVDLITFQNGSQTLSYLGFLLSPDDVGRTITLELQIDTTVSSGGTPALFTNAATDYDIVPEPGTGILLGMGLIGMALYRR